MPAPKGNKFAKGNKGGRPRAIQLTDLEPLGQLMVDWFVEHQTKLEKEKRVPFFSRFAREVAGCNEDTLLKYCEEDEVFYGAYKDCKKIQKEILIEGGLRGFFNPTAFIFTAKNITDMRDKIEVKNTQGAFTIADVKEYEN